MTAHPTQLWLGWFADEASLAAYVAERPDAYADGGDEIPLSQFCEDQGELFLDHDFFVAEYTEDGGGIMEVLEYLGVDQRGLAATRDGLADGLAGKPLNVVFVLSVDPFDDGRDVEADTHRVKYLGRFSATLG